jgi:cobalt/nickel transport system ATP-binding protein
VDSELEAMRMSSFHDLTITMLISTHDMRMVQELFPRSIVMDDGRIVADGMTKEILEDEEFLNEHGLEKP